MGRRVRAISCAVANVIPSVGVVMSIPMPFLPSWPIQWCIAAGRAGIIVPTGIATDDTTKYYFQEITEQGALVEPL